MQELNDFYRFHHEVLINGALTRYFDSDSVVWGHAKREPGLLDDRPVILALHGFGTSSYLFRHLITEFDGATRLIVPDLPGFGRSAKKLPWSPRFKSYYTWLEGFLRSVLPFRDKPRPVHIVGHDYGALLALQWTIDHPEEVASLVCGNTLVCLEQLKPNPALFASMMPIIGQRFGLLMSRQRLITPLFKSLFKQPPNRRVLDSYIGPYRQREARLALARSLAGLATIAPTLISIRRNLGKIQCPSSFLFGKDDPLIRSQQAPILAEMIQGSRYRCLPGVGHMPFEEAPAAVCAEISAMLSKLGVHH